MLCFSYSVFRNARQKGKFIKKIDHIPVFSETLSRIFIGKPEIQAKESLILKPL